MEKARFARAGKIRPSRTVSHTIGAAASALRQLSQARHVGKVVVRSPSPQVPLQPSDLTLLFDTLHAQLEISTKATVTSKLIRLERTLSGVL